MLGKENRQTSFFDTAFVCAHLIDKESFYAKMHHLSDKIVTDEEFSDIYCLNNGRPSVPALIGRVSQLFPSQRHQRYHPRILPNRGLSPLFANPPTVKHS